MIENNRKYITIRKLNNVGGFSSKGLIKCNVIDLFSPQVASSLHDSRAGQSTKAIRKMLKTIVNPRESNEHNWLNIVAPRPLATVKVIISSQNEYLLNVFSGSMIE